MIEPGWKAQTERSTPFMLRLMVWIARNTSRRVTRLLLLPITGYFLLTARGARQVSRQFLRKALNRPATLRDVARHLHCFASVVLDRLFFLMDRVGGIEMDIHRTREEERDTYHGPRGSLLFVSHLGSFEGLRAVAHGRGTMKVLLDREQGRMLTSLLETLDPDLAAHIIDASQTGPGIALSIKQALEERCRVGIMVDRARAGEQTVQAQFMGAAAPFPAGPWLLAAALQARVVMAFCLFQGGRRYVTHHELLTERLIIPRARRQEELRRYVQHYASRLEHYAKLAPYNWFNFYDFWNEAPPR